MLYIRSYLLERGLLVVLVITFSTLLIPQVFADYNESSIPVNVSIEAVTEIEISPYYLNWVNVTPGTAGGELEIDVKNIGSTNVTGFYAYIDTLTDETANPIGSSNSQNYAAGGFLTLGRNDSVTIGEEHYFAGRIEWNHTDRIELTTYPDDTVSWGWFRNASWDYVWALANGT
ncbi:MAG: hypothetical protein GF368_03920, partial [Candidatus Aenigmarchaeota archaeon]|nr:hypothetical protein [Candidatus Aenigmarchaeota archaeon]